MQFQKQLFSLISAALCLLASTSAFAGAPDTVAVTAAVGIKAEIMAKLLGLPEVDVNLAAQPELNLALATPFDQNNTFPGLGANGISLGQINLHDLYSGTPASGLLVCASSLVNNVNIDVAGVLHVTADAIGSTSTVSGSLVTAPLQGTGSVTLSNVKITILGIPLSIPANPGVNAKIDLGGLAALGVTGTITLNEQVETGKGSLGGLGIVNLTSNGLHIQLGIDNVAALATINVIVGQTSAQTDLLSDEIFPDGFGNDANN